MGWHAIWAFRIVVIRSFSQFEGMRIAYSLFNGTLEAGEHAEHFRCKEVVLQETNLKAHIDGEPVLFEHGAHLQIIPHSLQVMIPVDSRR